MEIEKSTAITRSGQLKDVERRLQGPDVPGITVDHVKGYGESANLFARDRTSRYARIEIFAERQVRAIIDAITRRYIPAREATASCTSSPSNSLYRVRDRHSVRSTQARCPRYRATVRLRHQERKAGAHRLEKGRQRGPSHH